MELDRITEDSPWRPSPRNSRTARRWAVEPEADLARVHLCGRRPLAERVHAGVPGDDARKDEHEQHDPDQDRDCQQQPSNHFGAYMPMPGSSESFFWFAGPSVTFADSTYMKSWFGVNAAQAAASGYRQYDASAGLKSAGFGVTLVWFINKHWFTTADAALKRLLGSAANSPITQTKTEAGCNASINYQF